MAALVRIALLGGLRVHLDERVVGEHDWPGRRPAELVALLALAERRALLRDQVLEALWPHLDPEAAAAQLRKAAHHARQVLGEEAVALAGGRVALFPGATVETDVEDFERAAAAALKAGDVVACAHAAELGAGELLPEARYEDWAALRREQLTRVRVDLLRRAGAWAGLVEADPTDEQAYRELMRAALAAGNRHAAIRWYGRLRTALERELGLRPDAESRALYEQCVADLGPARPAFVGRQLELATAEAALASAAGRGSGLVAIRGEAGIGKTTLCRQVEAVARGRNWQVVTITATAGCGAYAPLVEALETVLGADRTVLNEVTPQVRSTLAELTALAAPAPPPAAGLSRHMVIGAAHHVLMTGPEPGVLFVVDDAHLADDGTVEACLQLARSRGGRPLLVVVAYRPDAARPALTEGVAGLLHAERASAVDLGPMNTEELALLAGLDADPVRVRSATDLAQGNPFFALELLRSTGQGVPRSVWDAVTARFLDLDEATTAMLRRLAVAGDDLDVGGVLAMTGLSEPDAFALLDAGLDAGALVVAGTRYRFRHDLVRTALVEQVPPHHRIAIHRDAARRFGDAGAEPALIARHWLLGERAEEATGWLLAAARRAVKLGAYAEALRHLDTLVDNAPADVDGLCLRAEALDALGDPAAPAAYGLAADTAGEPAWHEIRAKQALALIKRGDPPSGLKVLDGISPVTVDGRLAEALAWAGAAVLGFAPPDLGTAKAAESRRLAMQTGDQGTLVIASWAQAAAAHARGDLRGSVWADLLDTASLPELAVNVFDGHLCISQRLLYGSAPYEDVIAFADRFEAEADRLGAARGRAYAVTLRGEAELLSGRLDDAETDLREAARLSRNLGGAVGEALALQRQAELALHRGRAADCDALLDEALAVARDSDVGFHLLDRIYGTRITAARGPDAAVAALVDAEASVRGPLETCPGCRITLAVPAAIAAARAGELELLAQWEPAVDFLADVVMRLPGWHAARDEVRGHAARARGQSARDHFLEAARQFTETGQPLDAARCRAQTSASA